MSPLVLILFAAYLAGMIGIGFWCSRSSQTTEGFYLGGRSLGAWVTAFSYAFSGMSAWVLIGYVGSVYTMGPSSFYTLIGFNIGFIMGYMIFAKRLRNYSEMLGSVTYTDFFCRRVRSCDNIIRVISGIAIVVFMAAYVASQLNAAGKTMSVVFGVDKSLAIILCAIVVTAYCVVGGFLAVSLTDFIQGLVIVIGVIILAFYIVIKAGGPHEVAVAAAAIDPNLVNASLGGKSGMLLFGSVLGYISYAFQLLGRPHDTIRFFAIKSVKEVRKAMMVTLLSLTLTYWCAFAVGYVGRTMYPQMADPELLFATLLTNDVHPAFGAILIVVLMGLMMSTIDSQLLSSASTLAEDLYIKYFGKKLNDKQGVRVTQGAIVLVAIFGTIVALSSSQNVFNLTNYASSGLACTYGPILFLSLYWKKLTGPGAVAGMIAGFVGCTVWTKIPGAAAIFPVPALPGFICGLAVAIVVSLLTRQPAEAEIAKEIEIASQDIDVKTV